MKAYRLEPRAPRGPVHAVRRSNFWVLAVVVLAGIEMAGMLAVPVVHAPTSAPAVTVGPAPAPAAITPAVTHGDLVVPSGTTYYIPSSKAPSSVTTYYQGGNITVDAGGTLVVTNTTLVFVEFIGSSGTLPTRLAHLLRFTDDGTVLFHNSTLTTSTQQINPYAKLNVFVNGIMTLWNSSIRTAGFLNVGTGGDLTLNQSSVAPNPAVANMTIANGTRSDFSFAPTLNVSGGGLANLFSTVYRGLYADNTSLNGTPGPLPLNSTGNVAITNATNTSSWTTPTGAAALTADFLYPNGILGGALSIDYNDSAHVASTVDVIVTYNGTGYNLGDLSIPANTTGYVSAPFTAGLVGAINTGGLMAWFNRTGDFGQAADLFAAFHVVTGPPVPIARLQVILNPPLNYGLSVTGAGSTLSTINTFLAVNFSALSAQAFQIHQLVLTDGATAYLGNLTAQGDLQNGTSQYGYGAVSADASSNAYLFRWADVNLAGRGGLLPVPNATLTAPYAYDSTQLNNLTAERANNLTPAMVAYLHYWGKLHEVASYGYSNPSGVASLLLASDDINGVTAPDGEFLGNYHVEITPPAGAGPVQGYNFSVSPYPTGVANGSSGYGVPDFWGFVSVPQYYADLELAVTNGVVVTADNASATMIRIGQELAVTLNVVDNGPAPITNLSANLYYNVSSNHSLSGEVSKTVDLTAIGQTASLTLTWKVNESVVGLHNGKSVPDSLYALLLWNQGQIVKGGGDLPVTSNVSFAPSDVAVTVGAPPPSKLSGTTTYFTSGSVTYNGSQDALVYLVAWPTGGGARVNLGETSVGAAVKLGQPVTWSIQWKADMLTPGKSYDISVNATYNGVWANKTLAGTFGTPGPSVTHLLTEKFLGLALWLWLVIIAAIVVGVVGFLWWSRRQAAGKLVECGECGNLVPEDARVCPKCGAEFESDVVRCSRCSSTIPANSQYCPECAAQLLGKPGEGGPDPERQAYADFTERYRAEAKKDLGDNYSEGAFWDWWKRQPSYTPFSQWKVQQGQGTSRTGMTAPPPGGSPPSGGAGAAPAGGAPRRRAGPPSNRPAQPPGSGAAPARPATPAAGAMTAAPAAAPPPETTPPAAAGAMKPCPNCGKEIPPEYLVCPFCGSVTQ